MRVLGLPLESITRPIQRSYYGPPGRKWNGGVCVRLWPSHYCVLFFPFVRSELASRRAFERSLMAEEGQ